MRNEVKQILTDLTVNSELIPVANMRYRGDSKTFVTWTLTGERPSLSAYDIDLYSVVELDVDVFSDKGYLDIVNEVKKRFISNDWVWVEDSPELFEDETGLYHLCITFEKERYIEWQE